MRRFLSALAPVALLVTLYASPAVLAQEAQEDAHEDAKAPAEDRAQSFQAVSGAVKEDVPGGPLLIAAYAFVWLAVFGYVWRLSRLHGRIDENLTRLDAALAKAAPRDLDK